MKRFSTIVEFLIEIQGEKIRSKLYFSGPYPSTHRGYYFVIMMDVLMVAPKVIFDVNEQAAYYQSIAYVKKQLQSFLIFDTAAHPMSVNGLFERFPCDATAIKS